MRTSTFALPFLATMLFTRAALGQAPPAGFALNRLEPSERGSEWFVSESMDFRGHLRPALGVVGDYQYRPLAIYDRSGAVVADIVKHTFGLNLGGSLIAFDRVRLGVSMPLYVYNEGDGGRLQGTAYEAPRANQGVGDLRMSVDVRLLGAYRGPATVGLGVSVWLPTGRAEDYTSDGVVRFSPHVLVGGNPGKLAYAAKVGVSYRGGAGQFGGTPVDSEVVASASIGLRLLRDALVVGPEAFASSTFDDFGSRKTTPIQVLFGAHSTIEQLRLGAGVGKGVTRGYGTPDVRLLFDVEWAPDAPAPHHEPPRDRDHDGVLDVEDACPDVAGIGSRERRFNGCRDRDRDGVFDDIDACVDVAGVSTMDPTRNGCPRDRDGDGIADAADACPEVAGIRTDDPKTHGCPVPVVVEAPKPVEDPCPVERGVRSIDPRVSGCLPGGDRDKDGVADSLDACPDDPGEQDPEPGRNGCPKARVQAGVITILDQIKFETGSAVIAADDTTQAILKAVVNVLSKRPEIREMEVQGHTDDRGSPGSNLTLSRNRAASVVDWLRRHAVTIELKAAGFGQTRPIDSNGSEAGRRANRRVEFHFPTGAGGSGGP